MITIIKNGKFTGTQYTKEQFSEEVQEFHKNDTWIDRELLNNSDCEVGEDGLIDYGSPSELELQEHKTKVIKQEAQAYINDTGWIWEKYKRNVEVLQNITKEEFLEKYQEVINKQEKCRKLL